jgi:hypothetical protein
MPRRKQDVPTFRLKLRRGKYHVSFTHPEHGKTVYQSLGTGDKATAERLKTAATHDILQQLFGGKAPAQSDYLVDDVLMAYGRSRGSKKDSTYFALQSLRDFFGGFKVAQLRNDDLWRKYPDWRTDSDQTRAMFAGTGKKVSDATACRELPTMRAAINWARPMAGTDSRT